MRKRYSIQLVRMIKLIANMYHHNYDYFHFLILLDHCSVKFKKENIGFYPRHVTQVKL